MLTRAEGEQSRIAVIFYGAGNIREEKASRYLDIDVYRQSCTWVDTKFFCEMGGKYI